MRGREFCGGCTAKGNCIGRIDPGRFEFVLKSERRPDEEHDRVVGACVLFRDVDGFESTRVNVGVDQLKVDDYVCEADPVQLMGYREVAPGVGERLADRVDRCTGGGVTAAGSHPQVAFCPAVNEVTATEPFARAAQTPQTPPAQAR